MTLLASLLLALPLPMLGDPGDPVPYEPMIQTHQVSIPISGVNNGTLQIPAFNPALGFLIEVDISGECEFDFEYRAEHFVEEVSGVMWWGQWDHCSNTTSNYQKLVVTLTNTTKKLVNEEHTLDDVVWTLGGYDGIFDFGGTSGRTDNWYVFTPMDPVTRIRNGTFLNEFYGAPGTFIDCPYTRTSHLSWCADLGSAAIGSTFESGWVGTATYKYAP